jgi:HD-GYP domain-containing protein (c-di-GMP phosphodiesterase class II)
MVHSIPDTVFTIIHERASQGWLVIDRHFRVVYVNQALCAIWRKGLKDVWGKSLLDLFYHGRKKDCHGQYLSLAIETMDTGKEYVDAERCSLLPGGVSNHWFLVNTYIVRNASGEPEYTVSSYVVINKFKAIESRLDKINFGVIKAFRKAVGARDAYTMHHGETVAELMVGLAEFMGMSSDEIFLAYLAGIAHDIGKIGIPEHVLNKPGKLDDDEYETIKKHPTIGADILEEIDGFRHIAAIVRHHHERYDGTGYPDQIGGNAIPMFSRMLALCDAFDAMTTHRVYRAPLSIRQAFFEISRCTGSQFDPQISQHFMNFIKVTDCSITAI